MADKNYSEISILDKLTNSAYSIDRNKINKTTNKGNEDGIRERTDNIIEKRSDYSSFFTQRLAPRLKSDPEYKKAIENQD